MPYAYPPLRLQIFLRKHIGLAFLDLVRHKYLQFVWSDTVKSLVRLLT